MICKKCGKSLKDNAKFCPYCGEKVESSRHNATRGTTESEGYSSIAGSQKSNPVPSTKSPKLPKGIVIAAASFATVAVIAGGVFVYFGSRENKDDSKATQGYEETVRSTEAVVKDTTEAALESTAAVSASAEEADISAVLAAYQQYADGLSEEKELQYSLGYINDDNVPECLIWFGTDRVRVLSYIDNTIKVYDPDFSSHTTEVAYTPYSGEFAVSLYYGVGGHDYKLVELSNSFTVKMHAESNGGFDTPGHWSAGYEINGESVEEADYVAQTDMSHFSQMMSTTSLYSNGHTNLYDTILSAYAALTSPEQPATQEASEFILPESNLRYMTYNDLKGIDATNLRIAKNEIYARHGRMFQSEDLSQYFSSKSWYNGTISPESFSDHVFNDFESGNIGIIQYFQDGTPDGHYYAYAFQYKYFEINSGVITVFAEPTSWGGGGGQAGYALSLPISDNCVWWLELEQKPYSGGKDGVLRMISDERTEYQKSSKNFQSPTGISVEVEGGIIVEIKVYIS